MSKIHKFLKDADADLDYGWDWGKEWLDDDTIVLSNWYVEDGINVTTHTHDGRVTRVFLSGGTPGETYTCTNSIITEGGRKDERTFRVKVSDR